MLFNNNPVIFLTITKHITYIKIILFYVELCLKQFSKNKAEAGETLDTVHYTACLCL